jgi:hypothetical protein
MRRPSERSPANAEPNREAAEPLSRQVPSPKVYRAQGHSGHWPRPLASRSTLHCSRRSAALMVFRINRRRRQLGSAESKPCSASVPASARKVSNAPIASARSRRPPDRYQERAIGTTRSSPNRLSPRSAGRRTSSDSSSSNLHNVSLLCSSGRSAKARAIDRRTDSSLSVDACSTSCGKASRLPPLRSARTTITRMPLHGESSNCTTSSRLPTSSVLTPSALALIYASRRALFSARLSSRPPTRRAYPSSGVIPERWPGPLRSHLASADRT